MRTLQAITTRYFGPTNVRGSRVKATCQAGSVTLHWDDALNADDNHLAAARALAAKFKWTGKWHAGGLPDGSYAFVCSDIGGPAFVSYAEER